MIGIYSNRVRTTALLERLAGEVYTDDSNVFVVWSRGEEVGFDCTTEDVFTLVAVAHMALSWLEQRFGELLGEEREMDDGEEEDEDE